MASFNKVMLVGNLTKDPEYKELTNGSSVANLRLAVSESYKNRSGETVESVCYLDVEVWGRQAETCRDYLQKGSSVLIEGRLKMDSWEKDGQKFNKLSVTAQRVQFLSPKGEASSPETEADDSSAPPAEKQELYPPSWDKVGDEESPFG